MQLASELNQEKSLGLAEPATWPSGPRRQHRVGRSLTDYALPARPSRHLPLHNRQHHRHRHSPFRHEGYEPVRLQSPPHAFRHSLDMMSPPEGLWATTSPGLSRPPSTLALGDEDGNATSQANNEVRLRLEQKRASLRDECLMQSLTELNVFSASMTKRLDERYYAVLEKMSTLQNTVAAMKVLAETSRNICDSFDKDTKELHSQVVAQLRAVSCLDQQEARISELQNRIHQDRSRIKALTDRIDIVRERVEGWERADRAWQENTRRRLKIIWSITSVATIIVIALAISVNSGRVATHAAGSDSLDRGGSINGSLLEGWLNSRSNGSQQLAAKGSGTEGAWSCTLRPDDDERLRAFDEL